MAPDDDRPVHETAWLPAAAVAAMRPAPMPAGGADPVADARDRMRASAQWHPRQSLGRRFAIGCVALEVTQRCNLDCSLCYLSEHAEAVHDLPLEEVLRRVAMIRAHYGPHTEVQVTGGDPTLRPQADLVAIVRAIAGAGMRASLFTNGIRASRALLRALSEAGLHDVAFHVDMTQGRAGYASEAALNAVRAEYLDRARGLPLAVVFNTTVFDGNFAELPGLVGFFARHAADINLVSFQLQAETGRGTLGARGTPITKATVAAQLQHGLGATLRFDALAVGHAACNRYALALVCNGRTHDMLDQPAVVAATLAALRRRPIERRFPVRRVLGIAAAVLTQPASVATLLPWAARKVWAMRRDLVAARGRVAKLTLFIHDFMDAGRLEPERIAACSFMVATADGPISMCLHNARRDAFVLRSLPVRQAGADAWWNPLTGDVGAAPAASAVPALSRKTAKGRRRFEIRHARAAAP